MKITEEEIDKMVDKFLAWPLPEDFYPDRHISFNREPDALGYPPQWPIGTNLFTAVQAKAMIKHLLSE